MMCGHCRRRYFAALLHLSLPRTSPATTALGGGGGGTTARVEGVSVPPPPPCISDACESSHRANSAHENPGTNQATNPEQEIRHANFGSHVLCLE